MGSPARPIPSGVPCPATACRFDDEWEPPTKYLNHTQVKLTSKVVGIDGDVSGRFRGCCTDCCTLYQPRAGADWAAPCLSQHNLPMKTSGDGRCQTQGLVAACLSPARPDGPTATCLQVVTFERFLPYDIDPGVVNDAAIYALPETVSDAGVEGLTFAFAWELYGGHHLVRAGREVATPWGRDTELDSAGQTTAQQGSLR